MVQPAASDILIELVEGDSYDFPGLEENECFNNDPPEVVDDKGRIIGSASCELEGGFLLSALKSAGFNPTSPGWWLITGFRVIYEKDYYGDVDADYSIESFRLATDEDLIRWGNLYE